MTLSVLNSILTPPNFPNDSGIGNVWPSIDEDLSFPSDYIAFINHYGTGRIADFIAIFNPFTKNYDLDFFEQKKTIIEDFNYLNNEVSVHFRTSYSHLRSRDKLCTHHYRRVIWQSELTATLHNGSN